MKYVRNKTSLQSIFIMTSGIFAGHNHEDHTIYGNMLCDVKSVGKLCRKTWL